MFSTISVATLGGLEDGGVVAHTVVDGVGASVVVDETGSSPAAQAVTITAAASHARVLGDIANLMIRKAGGRRCRTVTAR